jgi:hypothetical protein
MADPHARRAAHAALTADARFGHRANGAQHYRMLPFGGMPLVLSVPGLIARDAYPPARSLARLIALSGVPARDESIAAILAPLYGVRREVDWPLAPIRAHALGVAVGAAYWLGATPVTVTPGRDDLHLDGEVRDLEVEEARALIGTLNAHFRDDGIAFVAPRPDAWFVRADSPQRLSTHPLDAARGRALRDLLPSGADARKWLRLSNEIQMLLFEHAVNVARERAGKPPVNSVWLDYGGTMPERAAATAVRTWTREPTIAALAAFAGTPAARVPESIAGVPSAEAGDTTQVVAFDVPIDLDTIERRFASGALRALERGTTDGVTVVSDGDGTAVAWHAARPSLWSRWTGRFGARDLAALVDVHR